MRRFAIVVAALVLCACSKASAPTEGGRVNSWTTPHVLRYTDAADIGTLNPMFSQEVTLQYMSSLTAAFLVKWNHHNLPYPELATEVPTQANGGVSKDGLTITYHLRKGLRWSDGAPLDADDVVWSYRAVMNPANNVTSRAGWDRIVRVDEPDKQTVVFHLNKPYSPFIVTFFSSAGGNPSVLPKHLLAKYPDINKVAFNALPVGAGPFKYQEWTREQRVVMVPNPYYFRGQPKLKEVIFQIVPNRDTVFAQLSAHEIDMWAHVGGAYYARMNELTGYTALKQATYQWAHVDFNLSHPVVADPVVRHAIELATDRAAIIAKIGRGVGILQEGIAPKSAPYYLPGIPLVPFDIAQANKILDADGWKRGPDGIRAKNGLRLTLNFGAIIGAVNIDHAIELMRATWKQIGVAIDVHHYPNPQFFGAYADGGILQTGKWDVALYIWVDDPIGDFSYLYACDQVPPNGQNFVRWCNPKVDAATNAVFSHYDQAQRNADDVILFRALAQDRPQFTMQGAEEIYIHNQDLKNFHPNDVTPFDDFMNVDI